MIDFMLDIACNAHIIDFKSLGNQLAPPRRPRETDRRKIMETITKRYIIKDALSTSGNPRSFKWSDAYSDLIEFCASSDEEAVRKAEELQAEHDKVAEAICLANGEDLRVVWENAPSYVSRLYAEEGDDLRQVQV